MPGIATVLDLRREFGPGGTALRPGDGDGLAILAFPCNQVHYPALRQGVSG